MKDTRSVREAGFAFMGYFFFDFKDTPTRGIRGLPFSMTVEVVGDARPSRFESSKYVPMLSSCVQSTATT
jgi:hypothetical protein